MTKVMVATPVYGGLCNILYTNSLMKVPGTFYNNSIELYYRYVYNDALVTRARNELVRQFLNTDAEYLIFIDADIGFNASDIVYMINQKKDILCGIYPKKGINWVGITDAVNKNIDVNLLKYYSGDFVVNTTHTLDNEIVEIEYGGTGFMLINRNVFLSLINKVETYLFDGLTAEDIKNNVQPYEILNFFDTCICEKTKRLLSEDYYFCKLARDNGFTIHATTKVQLTHTGSYTFSGMLNP